MKTPKDMWNKSALVMFKREKLDLELVAYWEDKYWKLFKGINPKRDYQDTEQDTICRIFSLSHPREFKNKFFFPDLLKSGFAYYGGKSKRWFNNEFYHEQFLNALDAL